MSRFFIISLFLILPLYSEALEDFIDPQIYHNKYGDYYVPLNHNRPAVHAIKTGRVWEATTLKYIETIYEKGTSIVHAGTYFGDMLPFFSHLVGPHDVWAFEPVKNHFLCAQENCLLNNLKNVHLFNMALSNKNDVVTIVTQINNFILGGGSKIREIPPDQSTNIQFEYVQSVTLDEMLSDSHDRISLIHLDVEGYERYALEGALKIIKKNKPVLILEITKSTKQPLLNYLASIGYKELTQVENNLVCIPL